MGFVVSGYDRKPVPEDLRVAFESAVGEAREHAIRLLPAVVDPADEVYALQAIAALSGETALARVIEGFADGEFQVDCPSCARCVYVRPEGAELSAYGDDPVRVPANRTRVEPRDPSSADASPRLRWLAPFASSLPNRWVAVRLASLDGECRCPSCGTRFPLYRRLAEAAAA